MNDANDFDKTKWGSSETIAFFSLRSQPNVKISGHLFADGCKKRKGKVRFISAFFESEFRRVLLGAQPSKRVLANN
jgi:hypothetical protein